MTILDSEEAVTTEAPAVNYVNTLPISLEEIAAFKEKGYIKLRSLLTQDCVAALKMEALRFVTAASEVNSTYGNTFNRLTYSLGETDIVRKIYTAHAFRKVVGSLTGGPLIMTEAQGFELSKSRTGFPWHYDSLSFRYIGPQDAAYSIRIPLDTVDVERGGGGMAYVPENILSAKANFQLSSLLSSKMARGASLDEIAAPLSQVFSTPSLLTGLMEEHKEEDDFEPGDAFFFTKSAWHRAGPLKTEEPDSRLAVTIRFLDWRSRLDRIMFDGESESGGGVGMGTDWGQPKQTTYGAQFTDIANGEEIRDSRHCGVII